MSAVEIPVESEAVRLPGRTRACSNPPVKEIGPDFPGMSAYPNSAMTGCSLRTTVTVKPFFARADSPAHPTTRAANSKIKLIFPIEELRITENATGIAPSAIELL